MITELASNPTILALIGIIPMTATIIFGIWQSERVDRRAAAAGADSFLLGVSGQAIEGLKAHIVGQNTHILELQAYIRELKEDIKILKEEVRMLRQDVVELLERLANTKSREG